MDSLRSLRKSLGLCRCGEKLEENLSMCRPCRDRKTELGKKLRQERKMAGKCSCGREISPGKRSCQRCLIRHNREMTAKYHENIASGLCGCGRPPRIGGNLCEKCIEKKGKARYRKRASGTCYGCHSPARDGGTLCTGCLDKGAKASSYNTLHRKMTVIEHYGGKCACCGEGRIEFLTIDHINNDGAVHRKTVLATASRRGKRMSIYPWLIRHGFPEGFQVLCSNCNCAKGFYGICPHQLEAEKADPTRS